MPTYEYECLECRLQFEAVQSMKRPSHLTECPKCKGKVQRKIGRGAGIIFKGSGFYQTDYRSDSYKAAAKKDSEGSSSSSSTPKESSGSSSEFRGAVAARPLRSSLTASPAPAPPAKNKLQHNSIPRPPVSGVIRFLCNLLLTLWLAFLVAVAVESHRPATMAGVQGLEPVKGTAPDLLDRMEQSLWHLQLQS